ncbi:MAG: CRISPR-associated ring nuclease Csm6, partial [Chromatiaceae bacterium]
GFSPTDPRRNALLTDPHPSSPEQYPHRILLMVTGRTPQVVTETIYALTQRPTPFVPTQVHLITTAEGAQDANLALLDPNEGWFHRLCADYGLTGIGFDARHIHSIRDAEGRPVDDIRTEEEHRACADLITELVRDLTADENGSALHVSLAGGRKTMTYYLGNALTLFGRPQDRLSHVLVPPPYETNREFFYPSPISRPLYIEPLKRYFDAKDAQVTLADIPFVRLRNALPGRFKGLANGSASFTEVVTALQGAMQAPSVRVDYRRGGLMLGDGTWVPMGTADLTFYGWLAARAQAGADPVRIPGKDPKRWKPADRKLFAGYYAEFLVQARETDLREGVGQDMKVLGAMTYQFFHQRKTAIRKALEQAVGPLAEAYAVQNLTGERRPSGFGLRVAPELVRMVREGP